MADVATPQAQTIQSGKKGFKDSVGVTTPDVETKGGF